MRLRGGVLLAVLLAPGPARAGALGDVLEGLGKATGQKAGSSGGGSSGPGFLETVVNGLVNADWSGSQSSDPVVFIQPWYPPPVYGPSADLYTYVGIQSVVDSDRSLTLEVRASYDDLGIDLRGTSFYEGDLELDLGTLAGEVRLVHEGPLSLWLEVGGAGVSTTNDVHLFGLDTGARVERRLGAELGVSAEARHLWLEDGIHVIELAAAVHASVFQVSYRLMEFNVGPPLHGPEVGLALTF